MKTTTVTEINIYPIKSCGAVSLKQATLCDTGLENDRRWMVIDENNRGLTQREFARMTLIGTKLAGNGLDVSLKLSAPECGEITHRSTMNGERLHVQIHDAKCIAIDQGDEVANYLSHFFGKPVRLVEMAPDFARPVDGDYSRTDKDEVGFADDFPVLLISEASLVDLNSRLDKAAEMSRFRPNIVVAGCEPFAEDDWRHVKIGSADFSIVKPCGRCVIVTIDQATAAGGVEPLKTLASYRTVGKKAMFGQNLIHHGPGSIKLGDTVAVLAERDTSALYQ